MEKKEIAVSIQGVSDIMFDRFFDQSGTERPPEDKMYIHDGKVILPVDNLHFLCMADSKKAIIIVIIEQFQIHNWEKLREKNENKKEKKSYKIFNLESISS